MSKYALYGKFTVAEGEQDKLVTILLEAAEAMETVEDCHSYLVHTADGEPNTVYVYEIWKDEAAHQASLTLEATQLLIKQAKPIITGIERINTLKMVGGKM